jgi:DNA invertase Pin-like site-specific DNA recombinase
MRPWQSAHLQLLEHGALPVRRHEWQPPPEPDHGGGRHEPGAGQQRREQIRRLLAQGVKKRHIPAIVGISRTAVQKHLRAIKREDQHGR